MQSRIKVVLSVRVGVSGCVVIWIYQLIPPDMMMIGGSAVFCYLDSLTVALDLMSRDISCVNMFA